MKTFFKIILIEINFFVMDYAITQRYNIFLPEVQK